LLKMRGFISPYKEYLCAGRCVLQAPRLLIGLAACNRLRPFFFIDVFRTRHPLPTPCLTYFRDTGWTSLS